MTDISILNELSDMIKARQNDNPDISYTAKLLSKGLPKVTQKIGEEATEVVIAALVETKDNTISEIADLMYHLCVMMHLKEIDWSHIAHKLHERMNMSGLEEKAARKKKSIKEG